MTDIAHRILLTLTTLECYTNFRSLSSKELMDGVKMKIVLSPKSYHTMASAVCSATGVAYPETRGGELFGIPFVIDGLLDKDFQIEITIGEEITK